MINPSDMVFCVIKPALVQLQLFRPQDVVLLAGTCAAETQCGNYLIQTSYVPGHDISAFTGGLGPWQQERSDHDYLAKEYLMKNLTMLARLHGYTDLLSADKLVTDLLYAAMFARIHYLANSHPLPAANDIPGMAQYWKTYYNSSNGAGDIAHFIENYTLVAPAVNKCIAGM